MPRRWLPLALLLSLTLGCATTTSAPPTAPVTTTTAPAADSVALGDALRWVTTAAEYHAAAWQAFTLAGDRVDSLAAGRPPGSWAVSVDADETLLSNARYEAERAAVGGTFDATSWRAWVARREATALPGAREFLYRVRALGGHVVVVTNRKHDERDDTEANLAALDLPYDLVLTRGEERSKEPRWQAVAAGTAGLPPMEIVLWVGDNILDFPGLDQSLRTAEDGALAPFGDRFVVIPNPMYGSWK
jgi:5'-nucleotidase (lipoprotein e(P4) family)